MGYDQDDSMVRVDFFKESGKWYTTEAVKWISYTGLIHEVFAESLRAHFGLEWPNRLSEMDAICLEPNHEHAHPVMLKHGEWMDESRRLSKRSRIYERPDGSCFLAKE